MWKYASLKSVEVTHSPACREVLIVSGVSILNDSVFRKVFMCSRCSGPRKVSTGFWVWVPKIACCKTPVIFELLLHFCSPVDARPSTSGGFCGGWHRCLWQLVTWSSWVWTRRGGCSPFWVLLLPWDLPTGLPIFPKTGAIWPLQVDLEQQLEHLWQDLQNSSDLYRKHLWHILFLHNSDNNWELRLSFVATR